MTAEELERQLRGETSESRPSNNRPPPGAMGVQNGHPVSMAQYNVPPPTMVGSPHSRNMVSVINGVCKSNMPSIKFLYDRLKNETYYGNTCGGRCGGRASSTGFLLSKSKSFHPVFIKLGKYVGVHNVPTKFYNQPTPPPRHS